MATCTFNPFWDTFRSLNSKAWSKAKVTVEKDVDAEGLLRIIFYDEAGDPEQNVLRLLSEQATAAGLAMGFNGAGVHINPDAVAGKVPTNAAGDACYAAGPGNFPNANRHGVLQCDPAPPGGNPNANPAHIPVAWVKITQGYLRLHGPAHGAAGAHREQIFSRRTHASYTRRATDAFVDNKPMIQRTQNPARWRRKRKVHIVYFKTVEYCNEDSHLRIIDLHHIPGDKNPADYWTKITGKEAETLGMRMVIMNLKSKWG